MRTVTELLRLSYFDFLRVKGLKQREIAQMLGQSERHIRVLASKLKEDFFTPENEYEIGRNIEDILSYAPLSLPQINEKLPNLSKKELVSELNLLIQNERVVKTQKNYQLSNKYLILKSDTFYKRIDAMNHFLNASTNALYQRLILDDTQTARVKTISFNSNKEELAVFLIELESYVRQKISQLEAAVEFETENKGSERFTLTLTTAKNSDEG